MIRTRSRFAAAFATLLFACGQSAAQDATPTVVTLQSGDTLSGTLVEETDEQVVIDHPTLGRLTIPIASVSSLSVGDVTREVQPAEAEDDAEAQDDEVAPEEEEYPWEGSLVFGLSGSTGNSEVVNLRFGASARRETDKTILDLAATYRFNKSDGEETENRFYARAQHDWLFNESRWSWFALGEFEIDEFKDYDWRLGAFTGPGYRFIDNDTTRLTGRLGAGGAYEDGGPNDGFIPEGFAAIDFEHALNERSRITASARIYPSLEDIGEFRSRENAALEVDIDEDGAWALRLGAEHRYESDPGDSERNDLDYFVALVYSF